MSENLVVCAKCGGINRIAPDRPALAARCGKCKSKLFAGHPEDVDAAVFERLETQLPFFLATTHATRSA